MSRLDWGDNTAEALHMVKATLQTHENVLYGSAEEMMDGVVPTVNALMVKINFSKNLGLVLNALVILILGIMAWRNETKQPIIIYQTPQAIQRPPEKEHKSYTEAPQFQSQQLPQDAATGPMRP